MSALGGMWSVSALGGMWSMSALGGMWSMSALVHSSSSLEASLEASPPSLECGTFSGKSRKQVEY